MSIYKGLIHLSLLALLLSSCAQPEAQQDTKEETPVVRGVKVLKLHPEKPLILPGELHAWNKVYIYPKVNGFVKEVKADRGSVVKKGQVLALLDAPELHTELDKARAQRYASEAAANEAKALHSVSKVTYERLLKASQTPGAVATIELEQAKAKMIADSSRSATAEGNLKAALSHYRTQSELANYLTITAPFDGIINERNISPGALISAGGTGEKPMFVMQDNSTLRLTVAIPEKYANAINKSNDVSFTVNAVPDEVFKANFGRSSESIVEKNRVMITEFDIDNSKNKLKPGMYAEVHLPIVRPSETLFVPTTSIVSSSERTFIITSTNKKADWVDVKKGILIDSLTEVFGDIKPGEIIVRDASEEIREGQNLIIAQ